MPSEIRIYFEGDKSLKAGFDAFFREIREQASAARCRIWVVATGGKPERDFDIALRKHPEASNILLRDSEGPLNPNRSVSLCAEHGWPASQADSIFWMVEMMESWFHADKDALEAYYKTAFKTKGTTKGSITRPSTRRLYFSRSSPHWFAKPLPIARGYSRL